MALRQWLLPRDDRIVELAQSALERSRMDRVDDSHGVLITAEGLLMYLDPAEAPNLIADCAARFPGGAMKLDCIPDWVSRRVKLSKRYTLPSMPFALNADKARGLAGTVPGVRAVREADFPPGRAPWRYRLWKLTDPIGVLRRARHYTALLEFSR